MMADFFGKKKRQVVTVLLTLVVMAGGFSGLALCAELISLDIDGVVTRALSNNLGLKIEEISAQISSETVNEERSAFDPMLAVEGTVRENDDTAKNDYSISPSVSKKFKTGGSASLAFSVNHYDVSRETGYLSALDTEIEDYDNYFSSTLSFILSHPLLKNRGVDINTSGILISENSRKVADLLFQQKIIDVGCDAQLLYWEAFKAKEQFEVAKSSLLIAEKFLHEAQEKVRLGDLVPMDTLEAQAEVAQRKEEVITLENAYLDSLDALAYFIYGKIVPGADILLAQKAEHRKITVNEEEILFAALKNRTDYRVAALNLENTRLDVVFKKNQTLPEVDISASLSINGLEDTFGTSVEKMAGSDNYQGQLTISASFPWNFRKERAQYMRSRLEKKQAIYALKEIEQKIVLDVRAAIRNIISQEKKYSATLLSKKLSEEKLEAEEKKFKLGLSTSYMVLQYQRDLAVSAVNHIDALIAFEEAVVELNKVMGNKAEECPF